ncbi:ribonuclease domain-containing protein [Crenobacter sp. SG2303]|uniref:Ribonuclease domain-containing protein n=1 Tax=Crenobacter oryzisoli TaxID=3056844 RepID=A0ABT7XJ62_9NEIS|nr:ribonuclease domain-containing protein [Crenobacter sp. SG2303]MDN0073831.1 ribonuclease domain-containing protein [Crenobacter sp. SG2303]
MPRLLSPSRLAALLLGAALALPAAAAPSCEQVVARFASQVPARLDRVELVDTLRSLGQTGRLPAKFVTKRQARDAGWQPGKPLWKVPGLEGKAIGGDRFGNFEQRLPSGQWQEADLGYQGGKRGAQRLIFGRDGRRFITVDHYESFREVPACQ